MSVDRERMLSNVIGVEKKNMKKKEEMKLLVIGYKSGFDDGYEEGLANGLDIGKLEEREKTGEK